MAKFCPNCGKQMSDNSKFCMECGAKLTEYKSIGSVGNVNISPTIISSDLSMEEDICPKCGFKMKNSSGELNGHAMFNGENILYSLRISDESNAFACPKCKYKCIFSTKVSVYLPERRCACGGKLKETWNDYICLKCGKKPDYSNYSDLERSMIPIAIKNEGYDLLV